MQKRKHFIERPMKIAKDIQQPCSAKKKKKKKTKGNEVCSNTFSFHFRQSIQSLPTLKTLDLRHAGTLTTRVRVVEWGARSASAFAAPTAPPLSAVGFGVRHGLEGCRQSRSIRMTNANLHPFGHVLLVSGIWEDHLPTPTAALVPKKDPKGSQIFRVHSCPTFGQKKNGNEPRFPFDRDQKLRDVLPENPSSQITTKCRQNQGPKLPAPPWNRSQLANKTLDRKSRPGRSPIPPSSPLDLSAPLRSASRGSSSRSPVGCLFDSCEATAGSCQQLSAVAERAMRGSSGNLRGDMPGRVRRFEEFLGLHANWCPTPLQFQQAW